jgi:hypothetical protein
VTVESNAGSTYLNPDDPILVKVQQELQDHTSFASRISSTATLYAYNRKLSAKQHALESVVMMVALAFMCGSYNLSVS